jgi:phosphoglucomutase
LGSTARNTDGEVILLNENQSMILIKAFILEEWTKIAKITGNQFVGSGIVSTPVIAIVTGAME